LRKQYWECEFCHKKAHDVFPKDWLHGKSLVLGLGIFCEDRVRMFSPEEQQKYLMEWDATFCSLSCFFKWVSQKLGKRISEKDTINPTSRIS